MKTFGDLNNGDEVHILYVNEDLEYHKCFVKTTNGELNRVRLTVETTFGNYFGTELYVYPNETLVKPNYRIPYYASPNKEEITRILTGLLNKINLS